MRTRSEALKVMDAAQWYCSKACQASQMRQAAAVRQQAAALAAARTTALRALCAVIGKVAKQKAKVKACAHCGNLFMTHSAYCHTCRVARARLRRSTVRTDDHGRHARRARRYNTAYQQGITAERVAQRDGMRCQLCWRKVVRHLGGWKSRGWTIGHVIALAEGGTHTWDNVQCECMQCNTVKGIAARGQLGLVMDFPMGDSHSGGKG